NPLTDHAHVSDGLRIADELHLRLDLRRQLLPELPFLIECDAACAAERSASGGEEKKGNCQRESLLEHRNLRAPAVQFANRCRAGFSRPSEAGPHTSANGAVPPEDLLCRLDWQRLSRMSV